MERNYNNSEFEQYVKRNADQYRMIPSEKVWKGINSALHTRRKWYGIGLSLLLLLTAVSVTWVMVSYPVSKKQSPASAENIKADVSKIKVPIQPVNPVQPVSTYSNDISNLLSFNKYDKQDIVQNPDKSIIISNPVSSTVTNSIETIPVANTINSVSGITIITAEKTQKNTPEKTNTDHSAKEVVINSNTEIFNLLSSNEKISGNKTPGRTESNRIKQNSIYPLTIESVVNAYKPKKTRRKISWQLYFAPTISYRKLSANKSYKSSLSFGDPVAYPFASMSDVNRAVTHKPDMGLELGFSTRYPITKNLKLRGGLQFNINRYDIKAFVYTGELATINLSGGTGNNSLNPWTHYRNYNGYKTDWLKNFYFSVSAPIGVELKLFGNNKTSFGIAGTVQPTYILKDRAYLISTDYKNYAEVPSLIRDVNVNTSFETFINYTSRNKTKWQIGPQIRYQVLSSFQNKYPVRENLFDFGLKIGVTLN